MCIFVVDVDTLVNLQLPACGDGEAAGPGNLDAGSPSRGGSQIPAMKTSVEKGLRADSLQNVVIQQTGKQTGLRVVYDTGEEKQVSNISVSL